MSTASALLPADGAARASPMFHEAGRGPSSGGRGSAGTRDEAAPPSAQVVGMLIDRLRELVEQETAALRSRAQMDLKDFNTRKSHGLLDLSRAMRRLEGVPLDGTIEVRLKALKVALDANRAVLQLHVEAVREISTTVSEALRAAESDGTYTRAVCGAGKGP